MTEAAKKPGRWKTWALVGSVTLNLVMVGMIGGMVLRGTPDGSLMRAAIGALPDDARRDMRRDGREAFRGSRGHAELRAARADLLEALRAETFDADRFRAGLDVAQARLLDMGDRLEGQLVTRLERLDHPARLEVADRLESRTERLSRARD
ncbi:periplasmic heavy metal sensor [Roseibaca sp. Y0-43]|uniref:periplasmic heavy metal sensor n=1 Tax=Roseibaca sp. Y0-43 TaxID=2816854 RepID=UPI001D0C69FD|nr:periplasmic heavy metal sensor [Roseibaca sp. Y0-43]MCC1481004.1 periplasmic heavy metal sensor [Roseibaca sp. Y0-43]